jgi:AcrR family transcriptional regulator
MPRPRFLKLDPEKQKAILDAARAEFAQNGYESASYNRIIEVAGLSKGAMYYYFDDKLDVYATLLEDVNRQMMAIIGMGDGSFQPDGDFWQMMRDISTKGWTFAVEEPELATLMKGITALPRKARNEGRIGALYSQWRTMLSEMLRAGQASGQVRTDRELALLVEVAIGLDEALDVWLIDHMGELVEVPVDEVVDMVLDFWKRVLTP